MSSSWNLDQYLTFVLGEESFALNIGSVKEVLEHTRITKVPRTPKFMKGVINLRGHAVPIVDLRLKFGMTAGELTVNTCFIIIELNSGGGETIQIGALVDAVREVIEMNDGEVEPPPKMGLSVNMNFIRGMAKQGKEFVLILDVESIFSSDELAEVLDQSVKASNKSSENGMKPKNVEKEIVDIL